MSALEVVDVVDRTEEDQDERSVLEGSDCAEEAHDEEALTIAKLEAAPLKEGDVAAVVEQG